MYGNEDVRDASRRVRICILRLAAVLLPLLAVYVIAIIRDMPGLMLAALLIGFIWLVFAGDVWLTPSLRYARFLKDMQGGLRRSIDCTLESLEDEIRVQDGVRVRQLHVRISGGGDRRIFYINASKAALLPDMGMRVKLVSFGRHVVECGLC